MTDLPCEVEVQHIRNSVMDRDLFEGIYGNKASARS